jgi:folate-binding protein YgfZ
MANNYFIKNIFSKFIEIQGDDSENFLQGLITNDINNCNKENSIYACLLTPQGKFLADFFISKIDDYYLIEIHKKYYENFIIKLNIYKLRSKIDIKENKEIKSIILFSENEMQEINNIASFKDPRHKKIGTIIYLDENTLKSLPIEERNYDFYRETLIKHLIPFTPIDLIENKSLLLENNFQNINAIDWDKGCYVGQEITARMKYRSLLKKKIYVLKLISGNINPGDDIIFQDIIFGNVISKVNKYILCMLRITLIEDKKLNKDEIKISSNTIIKFL